MVKMHPDMILCRLVHNTPTIKAVECTNCQTRYPLNDDGRLQCNGQLHSDCPYCRPKYDKERALAEAKAIKELTDYGVF